MACTRNASAARRAPLIKGDLHPKDGVPEGTSSESKKREGDGKNDDDPISEENSLPSSAQESFSSALESFFD